MEEKKLVPKRRFENFTKSWNPHKLDDYTKLITKGTTPKDKSGKGTINFVKVENIKNGKIYPTSKISEEEHENYLKRSKLEENDILFSIAGTLGRTSVVEKSILPANTNQALAIIRDYNFDTKFLLTSLSGKVVSDYVKRNPTIGAQPNLSLEQVGDFNISAPEIEEQQKIGEFFKVLDKRIANQVRKIAKVKALKSAYLIEMFPREGEYLPKRRFKEFKNSPPWKMSTMKEVVDVYDGTHQTPKYTDSGVMFLSVENIRTLKSNKYISHEDFERDFKIFPQKDDVLMTRIGDIGTANIVESDENKAYYVSLALLKNRGLDPYFLKESIHSVPVKKELWHRTLHIAFPKKINMDEIGKVKIKYPNIEEQQKIGQFFKNLDAQITTEEKKLEKLKKMKEAYLEEMFV